MRTPHKRAHKVGGAGLDDPPPPKRLVRGMALIEALVASAVLGVGLAGATRLTLHALQTASETRQQTVAQVLAMDAMECHLSDLFPCPMSGVQTVQGTRYTWQSLIRPRADLALIDIEVRVQWPAAGAAQTLGHAARPTPSGASTLRTGEVIFHSSRDQLPAWVGVSLP